VGLECLKRSVAVCLEMPLWVPGAGPSNNQSIESLFACMCCFCFLFWLLAHSSLCVGSWAAALSLSFRPRLINDKSRECRIGRTWSFCPIIR
jgi:hypothetical protein